MAHPEEQLKDIAARLVNGIAAVIGIILLVIFAAALILGFINSCVDTPDYGDDFGLTVIEAPLHR
jgi:hypothetical protein